MEKEAEEAKRDAWAKLPFGEKELLAVTGVQHTFGEEGFTSVERAWARIPNALGVFALVVVFQPEIRRALDRIGSVGSLSWLLHGSNARSAEQVAGRIARAATALSGEGRGALIVLERETGLEEVAETGVMLHADLSAELLQTIFAPHTPLHDGAVIVREDRVLAAGAVLPLAETTVQEERYGTRHRAALEECRDALARAQNAAEPELAAEDLRLAARRIADQRVAGERQHHDQPDGIQRQQMAAPRHAVGSWR